MPARRLTLLLACIVAFAAGTVAAAEPRHLSFAHEEPRASALGIAARIFADKLAERSRSQMVVDQFPGAQLGREPQLLQKLRAGEVDLLGSTADGLAPLAPQLGVLSLHFVFRSEAHLQRALADPALLKAVQDAAGPRLQGARVLALAGLGFRSVYGRKEIRRPADLAETRLRVLDPKSAAAQFQAYGAQAVYLPFREVHVALRDGTVDLAENLLGVYRSTKHFEVAPVLSLTRHEAHVGVIWIAGKAWNGLGAEQRGWVQAAGRAIGRKQPARAARLEDETTARLAGAGVTLIRDVDHAGFAAAARPLQDRLAGELGPQAVRMLELIRAVE